MINRTFNISEKNAHNEDNEETHYFDKDIENMKEKLYRISKMVVEDNKMIEVLKLSTKVSKVDTTVIIFGETGVGKEGIAKYIHCCSRRKDKPFITINCGAIPENLMESELFGYEPGAFTGASREGKIGLFELADGGTIFLDEVGELPLEVQVKLLRVLQEKEIEKVGGIKKIKVDVRVLAATNKNLKELMKKNKFREDLYYRLCVFPIEIPPLRQRKDDIVPLIKYFAKDINKQYNLNCCFSDDALECLYNYEWPGNVRELRNIVERYIVINDRDVIRKEDFPDYMSSNKKEQEYMVSINNFSIKGYTLKDIVRRVEIEVIEDAIERYGNVKMAAKVLGIDPSTLSRKRQRNLKRI